MYNIIEMLMKFVHLTRLYAEFIGHIFKTAWYTLNNNK